MELECVQRIMVVGQPGAGKSHLATWLAVQTGLPLYHMDHLHWCPNWVERPMEQRVAMAREIEARERWIFEGSLAATYDDRVARADLVIWLDLPLWLRLYRVTRRALAGRGRVRPDMQEGCPERLGSLPGFWRFIWKTRVSSRARIAAAVPKAKRLLHLTSTRAVARFQSEVSSGRLPSK